MIVIFRLHDNHTHKKKTKKNLPLKKRAFKYFISM